MHQITCCAALVSPKIDNVIVEMSHVFICSRELTFMNLFKSASHFSLFYLLFATIIMVNKDFQKKNTRKRFLMKLFKTGSLYCIHECCVVFHIKSVPNSYLILDRKRNFLTKFVNFNNSPICSATSSIIGSEINNLM